MENKENKENKEELTLEDRFAVVEELLEKMEKKDVTLEQAFALYKEGLEQLGAAGSMLDSIEQAFLVLNEDGETEEF